MIIFKTILRTVKGSSKANNIPLGLHYFSTNKSLAPISAVTSPKNYLASSQQEKPYRKSKEMEIYEAQPDRDLA